MTKALSFFLFALSACGATYYVDCGAGSDRNSGISPSSPWQSLTKISATTFSAGDSILLRRGVRCEGPLRPKGSGEDGRPIHIGAYGEGRLPATGPLSLVDQQYWEIENLDISGGDPYGVHVSASRGDVKHIVLRNLAVHDVGGVVKQKASGLVVITAGQTAALEDILVDGVTAWRTSQWAGIYISGSAKRARNVVVRNSIVHDVEGDGIVLFQAENGRIEKSAAWHTGLQEKESIGTPNAIWTWSCRNCVVENNEGFWIDSPGVDGGVYDIDWGNEDNTIQSNYGHDAQGYCAAVFGAGKRPTTNSVVRYNVCVNNGRSPKLARRQGDLFTMTWDGGSLDGLSVDHNTFIWNPPVDAPAIHMDDTAFTGSRPNVVSHNLIYSAVPSLVQSGASLKFDRNLYWSLGKESPKWIYAGREYAGVERWHEISPGDLFDDPGLDWLLSSSKEHVGIGAPAFHRMIPAQADAGISGRSTGNWLLLLFAGKASPDARSQLVFVQTALAQYGDYGLEARVIAEADNNLQYDWNFGAVRSMDAAGLARGLDVRKTPVLLLVAPGGQIIRRWEGFAAPADLGLTLKHYLGSPPGDPELTIGKPGALSGEGSK